jgi:hypothetical protein
MFYVKLYSFISKAIGYITISMSGLFYIQKLIIDPIEKVTPIAITAIATIATLSALCFSFVQSISDEHDKNSGLYAGEKFLHSTLLIILTLFLKYSTDQTLSFDSIKSIVWLKITISIISYILLFGIGGYAVTMAALGFHELNKILWTRFEKLAKKNLKNK